MAVATRMAASLLLRVVTARELKKTHLEPLFRVRIAKIATLTGPMTDRNPDGAMAPPAGPSLPGRSGAARSKDTRDVPRSAVESFAEYRLDQQTGGEPTPVKHFHSYTVTHRLVRR